MAVFDDVLTHREYRRRRRRRHDRAC